QAFIASFDVQVDLLQDFTSSRQDLQAALADLRIPGQFATLIFSAVRTCAENMMRKRNGRKAFILLSDGVAFRDESSIETAIEYAQRADTIIYSILFADHVRVYRPGQAIGTAIMAARGRKALQRLAEETGGAYFQVNKEHSLEEIYSRIE